MNKQYKRMTRISSHILSRVFLVIAIIALIGTTRQVLSYIIDSLRLTLSQNRDLSIKDAGGDLVCLKFQDGHWAQVNMEINSKYRPFLILSCSDNTAEEIDSIVRIISEKISASKRLKRISFVPIGRYSVVFGPDHFFNHDFVGNYVKRIDPQRVFGGDKSYGPYSYGDIFSRSKSLDGNDKSFDLISMSHFNSFQSMFKSNNLRVITVKDINNQSMIMQEITTPPGKLDQNSLYILLENPSLQDKRISYLEKIGLVHKENPAPELLKKLKELKVYRDLTHFYVKNSQSYCFKGLCAFSMSKLVK